MASRITVYRLENGRRVSLVVSRMGAIEDVTYANGQTAAQIQYPMPNGSKYISVRDSFESIMQQLAAPVVPIEDGDAPQRE